MIRRQPLNFSDIQTLLAPKFNCSGCKHRKEGPKPHKPTIDNYELGSALCCDVAGPNRPPSVEKKEFSLYSWTVDLDSAAISLQIQESKSSKNFELQSTVLKNLSMSHHKSSRPITQRLTCLAHSLSLLKTRYPTPLHNPTLLSTKIN